MTKLKSNQRYLFYKKHFKRILPLIAILILLIIVGVVSGNINPFIYGKIIDFITAGDLDSIPAYIFVFLLINLFAMLLSMVESYIGQLVSYSVSSGVRKELFAKITRMRFKSLDGYNTGELISRLDSDAGTIVDFFIDVATSITLIVFNLVVSLYFVFTISAALSFVSIFFVPASAIVTIAFRKRYRTLEMKQKEFFDKYMGFVNETFSNIRGIRSYRLEDDADARFNGFIGKRLKLIKNSIRLNNTVTLLKNLISTTFGLLIIYLSAKYIIRGVMTIGSMVAFNTYINKLFDAVSRVLSMNTNMQGVTVAMDRVEKMMSEPDETPVYEGIPDSRGLQINNLCVDNVSFKYNEKYVLKSLDINCNKPGLYAVVGKNGCGKSTLAKIIMGFYDCENGEVTFGGHTVEDIGLTDLRQRITYIQKEPFIINDSVMNNIKLASPDATDDMIIGLCRKTGFHGFIESLPEKYETNPGEGGSLFSSGQKQKLSLIRALLPDSELVILDEVTSDLDGTAEKEMVRYIRDMSKDRIVLFISHRIASIMDSDKIFLLDDGCLSDSGTHSELLDRSGLYRDLFRLEKEDAES